MLKIFSLCIFFDIIFATIDLQLEILTKIKEVDSKIKTFKQTINNETKDVFNQEIKDWLTKLEENSNLACKQICRDTLNYKHAFLCHNVIKEPYYVRIEKLYDYLKNEQKFFKNFENKKNKDGFKLEFDKKILMICQDFYDLRNISYLYMFDYACMELISNGFNEEIINFCIEYALKSFEKKIENFHLFFDFSPLDCVHLNLFI
ncbi:hypothetical protein GVAV_000236 [Gurleya vavrai]